MLVGAFLVGYQLERLNSWKTFQVLVSGSVPFQARLLSTRRGLQHKKPALCCNTQSRRCCLSAALGVGVDVDTAAVVAVAAVAVVGGVVVSCGCWLLVVGCWP